MKQEMVLNLQEMDKTVVLPEGANSHSDLSKASRVEQIYQDFCTRRDAGEAVDPDEFLNRFPSLKGSLQRLLHAHLYLEENSFLLADSVPGRFPSVGESFLGFHLLQELGKGTFARVFLARESKLGNRLVAVKIVKSLHGGVEAKILGQIKHPNIMPVHSAQEDDVTGLTAICMPYMGSATLCDLLDNVLQTRPFLDGVRFIGAQIADALAYIHHLGICHRDLKPSNVLMNPEGTPMLLDFNLSSDAKEAKSRLGGTLPYMAPEQLRTLVEAEGWRAEGGDRREPPTSELDGRADIFSLGVILYQLVTASHPFGPVQLKMNTEELCNLLLQRHQRGAVNPCQINPLLDRDFGRVLQRCLAFDRNDRPQSAAEIADILRKGLTPLGRVRRWLVRNSHPVMAAAVLFTLLGTSAVFVYSQSRPYSERQHLAGQSLFREGRFAQAVQYYDTAVEADPKFTQGYFDRGRAYQQMGQDDEKNYQLAIDDYARASATALASYLAMNFTGASTFSNPSGVRKELRYAIPAQLVTALAGLLLIVLL